MSGSFLALATFATLAIAGLVTIVVALRMHRTNEVLRADLERALSSVTEIHRETLDSLSSAVVVLDDDGQVVLVNRVAARLLGRFVAGNSTGGGQPFGPSLPPVFGVDGQPRRLDADELLAVLESGRATEGELIGTRLADGVHWFEWSATPVHDSLEHRRLVVLVLREVTSEKRLNEQLEMERTRFRLAFEEAPIGKAIVAADGTFVEMNRAVCDLLRRSRSELFGCRFQDITHPDDLDADLALLQQLVDGRADNYRLEKRYLSPTGDVIHALLSVSAVRPDTGEIYFIAQIIDRREQKEAETLHAEALEREREIVRSLREFSSAKTNFVSTVSHELRTPLTSILGYVEMLIDETGGELSVTQEEMLGVVDRNGRRLLELIEDLLTVTTIDAHSLSLQTDPVSITEVVEAVGESMMPIAGRNAVSLDMPIRTDEAVVLGDRGQLERVLTNLVSNAIKFTPADGRVTIDVSADDEHVTVSVTDTGVGIPESEQDQVFERFFRTTSTHHQAVPGTGLGLSIASDLVEAHGGTIRLSSEPGVGTHVWFTLPLDGASITVPPVPLGPPDPLESSEPVVGVIDDAAAPATDERVAETLSTVG
ncbi:MAG: ATP-binding protein [Actinomycetota bacterium]